MVPCASHHFTVAINNHTEWICIDDLNVSVRSFTSIQDLQNNYPNGCFFAAFKRFSSTIQTDLDTDSPLQAVFPQDKCYETMQGGTQPQVPKMSKMFLNQVNTTLLRMKLRKTVNKMIWLIRENGDDQTQ